MLFKKRTKEDQKRFDIFVKQPRDSIIGETKYQITSTLKIIPVISDSIIYHLCYRRDDFSIILYAKLWEELKNIRKWKRAYDKQQRTLKKIKEWKDLGKKRSK